MAQFRRLPPRLLLLGILLGFSALHWSERAGGSPVAPASPRDSVVVFNEVHYHPAGDRSELEFVELYNQMAVDVDLSNWRIGGIDYNFPERTIIRAGSYLVVAKDPAALRQATGVAATLGPYPGLLSNSGETLRLFTQRVAFKSDRTAGPRGEASADLEGRRIMDELAFSDTFPWPEGPDGSGVTLAKLNAHTGIPQPSHWGQSRTVHGTPGRRNSFPTVPALQFSEVTSSLEDNFFVEIVNTGTTTLPLQDLVIASSHPDHEDVLLAAATLPSGDRITLSHEDLGYRPEDNNRLFLFTQHKQALIDSVRVDNRARARHPGRDNRWLRPDQLTRGTPNSFSISEDIIINEILYHAYPHRTDPDAPQPPSGTVILPFDALWRYEATAGVTGLPAGWAEERHTTWPVGRGLLARESSTLGEPIHTNLVLAAPTVTYYFETEFNINADQIGPLVLEHYVDDGAVFYLNGVEIARFNLPEDEEITPTTAASGVPDATVQALSIPEPNLVAGVNRLSIEVHQSSGTSIDLVCGARLVLPDDPNAPPAPLAPYAERDEEWLELFNRGNEPVDLSGWRLAGGIGYRFPEQTMLDPGHYLVVARDAETLARRHPQATILGDYSNRLGNGGDLVVLEDQVGNSVDEVVYHDSGHWHGAADGGGSSLELRHPHADNSLAQSWAPSDEASRSRWQTFTYEGVSVDDGIGNNVYHEFLLGMLDAGEFLLDDVSVIEDPGGANLEFIQNGTFDRDTLGVPPQKWRCLGTHGSHGRTVVVTDPDDRRNRCLHVVATGPTEDKHNKLETTYRNNERVAPRRKYRIRFRAKWLSGSNQVNTRLYFNYLQKTQFLQVPDTWGTPGRLNSAFERNTGPNISGMTHQPAVPNSGQAVRIQARITDVDDIDNVQLFYSVNGASFRTAPMTDSGDGNYVGSIPGQSSSRIVRFFLRAVDGSGATSNDPPAAEKGGAFYKVQDRQADNTGRRHNLRIMMSEEDRQFLMTNTNRLSNDRFPGTVIENESIVYYDVGIRLKGSAFGRFNASHYGFNLLFQPDQRFRGVHDTISIERSPPLREIFAKHLINRAGGTYASFYDDVAMILNPTSGDRSVGLLSMSRQTESFFDSTFPHATESGTLFNHELLYNPNGTDGGPEGLKRGNPYNHTNGMYHLDDRGEDKEPYRWGFQIRSARGRDDYSRIVALNRAMELRGSALRDAVIDLIDVDQWMRTFAIASLNGTDDITGRLYPHNFRFYVRPTDQKVLAYQWDLDRSFRISSNASLPPYAGNIPKLFQIPEFRRIFHGHLLDLIESTFNSTYASPWATHLSSATGQSFSGLTSYITNRSNYVRTQLPRPQTFRITTQGGSDFSTENSSVTLAGDGWINVFSVEVNGVPTELTWTDDNSWKITVPISLGPNQLTLTARDNRGSEVGTDTVTVTNTSRVDLASADNVRISELHYHPLDATPAEMALGINNQDRFEYVELCNISDHAVDFTGVSFTDGISYDFPADVLLGPGEKLVLVSDPFAFEARYGKDIARVVGEYSGNFRNSGEHVRLEAADDAAIADFTYGDHLPWPQSADGQGFSLVFLGGDRNLGENWRTSVDLGGTPGTDPKRRSYGGAPASLLDHALPAPQTIQLDDEHLTILITVDLQADDVRVTPELSVDLERWNSEPEDLTLVSRFNKGDGTATLRYQIARAKLGATQYARIRVETREAPR